MRYELRQLLAAINILQAEPTTPWESHWLTVSESYIQTDLRFPNESPTILNEAHASLLLAYKVPGFPAHSLTQIQA